jgi:hypothetical protein
MILGDEPALIYRLYWRARHALPTSWWWRDFANEDDRSDYLEEIRPAISEYALQEGEDLEEPRLKGTSVILPADLNVEEA